MKKHKIQWLNLPGYKGETWNPVIGCSKVSEGCKNCYAEKMAARVYHCTLNNPTVAHLSYCEVLNDDLRWNGETVLIEERLTEPAKWRQPRLVFVCSMGDLFHKTVSFYTIDKVMEQMMLHPRHIYIVLTKRAGRMAEYFNGGGFMSCVPAEKRPHIFLGVTAENQQQANMRIPYLNSIASAVKLVSVEPMLGPVDLINLNNGRTDAFNPADAGIDWVICGGESGHNARPMHPDWVRSLRNQCQAAGVAFFFKQWGEWKPFSTVDGRQVLPFGKYETETKFGYSKVGKHKSGNLLDGVHCTQYPEIETRRITPTLKGAAPQPEISSIKN
jgi:protein gp37